MEFDLDHARRVVVIENSDSRKSHLADHIAQAFALSEVDLNQFC
jgi:hypothetical protein